MFLSVRENIKLFLSREKNKYNCDAIFETELTRILPNLKIREVVVGADTYRNNSIRHAVEQMRE